MSEKEPYQPTKEEIKKAEDRMTKNQKEMSKYRKELLGVDNRIDLSPRRDGTELMRKIELVKDGRIILKKEDKIPKGSNSFDFEINSKELSSREALNELDDFKKNREKNIIHLESEINDLEMQLNYVRTEIDNINRFREKIVDLSGEQEKKEN
jgi:chromosome segregation ATPase